MWISQNWERLKNIARKVWRGITPRYLKNLYQSMPRCMQAVIDNHRGHTKYWGVDMHILNNFIDNKLTKCNLDAILISKVVNLAHFVVDLYTDFF